MFKYIYSLCIFILPTHRTTSKYISDADIDECISSKCINGICEDSASKYICYCANGFTGSNCEKGIWIKLTKKMQCHSTVMKDDVMILL